MCEEESHITIDELAGFHARLAQAARGILCRKGEDYGKDKDALGMFRDVSALCGGRFSPEEVALVEASIKLVRLWRLISKPAANEPRRDSILDLINYLVIAEALREEHLGRSIHVGKDA